MKQAIIHGHRVQVFETSHGTELYISDCQNNQLYGHKCSERNPFEFARQLIESWR